jgi:hypothetical protein
MKLAAITVFGVILGIIFASHESTPFLKSAATTSSGKVVLGEESTLLRPEKNTDVVKAETASDETVDRTADDQSLIAERALQHKIDLLKQGRDFLNQVSDYTATIRKREVVGGELLEEQKIEIKCRCQPFSVYLHWITGDPGREVIFIEGANKGRMIAHDGGWKMRIPAFYLSPDSSLAMRDARYPVTSAGLLGLIDTMLDVHRDDLNRSNFDSCTHKQQQFEGRQCELFTTTYKSADESPVYRKSITYIDAEWHVPLYSRHYEWPNPNVKITDQELDEATLLESYRFTQIQFDSGVSDTDFDRHNKDYNFR